MPAEVSLITRDPDRFNPVALDQLRKTAGLPGMQLAVGLPDLHPGNGIPVGAVFASAGWIYPHLAGGDIGCGMRFDTTDLTVAGLNLERMAKRLGNLDAAWDGDADAFLTDRCVPKSGFEHSLGTIGKGNHFAELQRIEEVVEPELAASLGLDAKRLTLLVHSGSRGFGQAVLDRFMEQVGKAGSDPTTPEARTYLEQHDQAVRWAKANRELIAHRVLDRLNAQSRPVIDVSHNLITERPFGGETRWLHRKGAAPSDQGVVVIPGSRGTLSYLVRPLGDHAQNGYSLAHGAGRKWARSDSRERLEKRFTAESLRRTALGGIVVCNDRDLIFEEAPDAYKDIRTIIEDLEAFELIQVIATLRPVLTYKTSG